jgi:hypothetical protein
MANCYRSFCALGPGNTSLLKFPIRAASFVLNWLNLRVVLLNASLAFWQIPACFITAHSTADKYNVQCAIRMWRCVLESNRTKTVRGSRFSLAILKIHWTHSTSNYQIYWLPNETWNHLVVFMSICSPVFEPVYWLAEPVSIVYIYTRHHNKLILMAVSLSTRVPVVHLLTRTKPLRASCLQYLFNKILSWFVLKRR